MSPVKFDIQCLLQDITMIRKLWLWYNGKSLLSMLQCNSNAECNTKNCNDIGRCGPETKIKGDSDNQYLIVDGDKFKY